jgi:hypothetical protein
MKIIAIIGAVSFAVCLAGTIVALIDESKTPKLIKIFTCTSMIPLVICFSILAAFYKESNECKTKYKKVNVELYEKVE